MQRDDVEVGRLITRREALVLIGASSAALLTGWPGAEGTAAARDGLLPSCVVRPEQTEGPYFVDERLNRSDIRSDPRGGAVKAGVPLRLAIKVSRINDSGCPPLAGASVDLWHCDALGVYSDVEDPRFNTIGQQFLRGFQRTDAAGTAQFTTIYPGWYHGRTVHVHFKIRTAPPAARGYQFTSQLYFDDALTDRVHALAPYASNGQRTVRNRDDGIFAHGGQHLMLELSETSQGYEARFDLGLQMA